MKAVVAIDSFKGSLSSWEAAQAAKEGIKEVYKNAHVDVFSIADGGEGTLEAIMKSLGAKTKEIYVTGPLGQKICAEYGISDNGVAIIEMSKAAGLTLVPKESRNPLYTTTRGVGEMIADAIQNGCRKFVVGIGGSATNDGGVGMLKALGFEFFDKDGKEIPDGGAGLETLAFISKENALPKLCECEFEIACDVTNPLCGSNGCSAVFARQKGADDESIAKMDGWLASFAKLSKEFINRDADDKIPGSGAAGGLGFAFVTYLGAVLKSGIDLVLEKSGIEDYIKNADIIVTGEGRIDSQTVMGKAPAGVAHLAKKYNKTVIAFCGSAAPDAHLCNKSGIDGVFPVVRAPISLDEAMEKTVAYNNLKQTAIQVFNLIKSIKG